MGKGRWLGRWVLSIAAMSFVCPAWAGKVNFTLLHLNDVYEITAIDGGKSGGLARVATLKQQLLRKNPRTYTVMAGDFLSPSALGTARVNNEAIAGAQMIAVLNAMGLNFATFGNHEFDLKENQFRQRLQEAKFRWFSGNVSDVAGKPFPGVPRSILFSVAGDADAKTGKRNVIRVGLIGVTINSNPASYVTYQDPIQVAKEQVRDLKSKADVIVAVTHLSLVQDQQLAQEVPEIDLILGGHEHENIQQWRGRDFTPVFKADANARTVYIHNLTYDTDRRHLKIDSQIQPITDAIAENPKTAQVVRQWLDKGFAGFRSQGFDPDRVVATIREPLDGLESSVRNRSTTLTQLIAQAMLKEAGQADLAVFNGGSIRIDDILQPGTISQYDVIRILPFGGKILVVDMQGSLLKQVLQQGQANRGNGGFLQTENVMQSQGQWLINQQAIADDRPYRVAINDFLLSGREIGLDYLTLKHPGVKLVAEKRDIRLAVIDQLKTIAK
jgi:5'-nucleotidase